MTAVTVFRAGPVALRVSRRGVLVATVLFLGVAALVFASLLVGSRQLSLGDLADVLTGDARDSLTRSVLGRRLPRALTAALVGMLLAASGALFQSLSRNPLGSPDVIGFTSGAATGAVAQIILFGGGVVPTALAAIGGGLATALVVYVLARRDGITGGIRLVLVGIGVGSMLSAVTSLLLVRADITDAVTAQVWTAGSLTGRGWPHVVATLIAVVVLLPPMSVLGRSSALAEMGDDSARALGIAVERDRFIATIVAVTAAAAATAATGPIAFIAFAAPQITRRLVPRPGVQIWTSAAVGAVLLCGADLLSQNLDVGLRTPVGLVASVLGGGYLLWILARRP